MLSYFECTRETRTCKKLRKQTYATYVANCIKHPPGSQNGLDPASRGRGCGTYIKNQLGV